MASCAWATYLDWVAVQRAFYFGEEQRKFSALVGSPTAAEPRAEFQTNYSESQESSFRLGVTAKGKERKLIIIAGSMEGRAGAEKTYQHLTASYADLLRESAEYYRDYLEKTVSLELPDAQIQQAYDWSRVSVLQGMVNNPYLGSGLVAGYRTSGESQRPGFAWFFGRDSFWTSFALMRREILPVRARRSSLSASTSGKTARFHTKFRRARVLCSGSRIIPTHTLQRTPRRYTSSR